MDSQDDQFLDHETIREQLDIEAAERIGIAQAEDELGKSVEAPASTAKKEKRETPPNSGSMFKNEKKSTTAHPDITGSAMVGGLEYWVSGWRKNGAKGDFYSLSFKPKTSAAATDLI